MSTSVEFRLRKEELGNRKTRTAVAAKNQNAFGFHYRDILLWEGILSIVPRSGQGRNRPPATLSVSHASRDKFIEILALEVVIGEQSTVQHDAKDTVGAGRVFLQFLR